MTNATRPPDIDGMIGGGLARRRRRNAVRAGVAAVAVLALGGGGYAATQLGDGDTETGPSVVDEPSVAPSDAAERPPTCRTDVAVELGTCRRFVASDESVAVEADLTFGAEGWESGDHPVLAFDGDWGGATVYQATRLAGADYCSLDENDQWQATSRPAAEMASVLASQLARLPQSTVIEPITPTQAYGYDALHLRLRIVDDCGAGVYHLADTSVGAHGISYYDGQAVAPDVIVDFLVVDVEGIPIVAEFWHHPQADPELISELISVRDSISFVTSD